MKKHILIVISLTLVLLIASGCGSMGGKKFDSDGSRSSNDDSVVVEDDTEDEKDRIEIQKEDTEANDADIDDTDIDDTNANETQDDETNTTTSQDGANDNIVGVWTNWKDDFESVLSVSYAQKFINADMTDSATALAFVNEIKGDSAITGSVFVNVYRRDGTGFTFFVASSGYGWCTFNYSVEGDTLHKTDRIYTSEDEDPNWTFQDKPYDDESTEFRFSVYNGKDRLFLMPDIPEDSELASYTVEEYIEWMHEGEWKVRLG